MVSVIIPVYNAEAYLKETLDSLLKQTVTDIEIILVNDGSKDKSCDICEEYVKRDDRIKLIDQPNQGVSAARNNGIKSAKGEWLCFVDSDDWVEPDFIEVMLKSSEADDDIVECSCFINNGSKETPQHHHIKDIVFSNRDEINQLQIQLLARKMCKYQPNSGDLMGAPWGKLFRKSFVLKNDLTFDINLPRSQDLVFNLYALEKAKQVRYIDVPLYHYRINEESVCNKFLPNILKNVTLYLHAMDEFLIKHDKGQKFRDAYNVKVLTSIYKCMYLYFFNKEKEGSFKEVKNEILNFIEKEPFYSSIKKVKYKNLDFQEKIFAFFLKHKAVWALKKAVEVRTIIKYGKK